MLHVFLNVISIQIAATLLIILSKATHTAVNKKQQKEIDIVFPSFGIHMPTQD